MYNLDLTASALINFVWKFDFAKNDIWPWFHKSSRNHQLLTKVIMKWQQFYMISPSSFLGFSSCSTLNYKMPTQIILFWMMQYCFCFPILDFYMIINTFSWPFNHHIDFWKCLTKIRSCKPGFFLVLHLEKARFIP